MHSAKIICDSVSPLGIRLTTMEVVFPRIILAEFNTHRMFSRNSASSRAIPIEKMIKMVEENPYTPIHWGKNQKGMQAEQEVDSLTGELAAKNWLMARDQAIEHTRQLLELGIHKQITNRLLEPFMWHTVIVTATEWSNFFHLRNHSAAHPDIQAVAKLMQEQYETNKPKEIGHGEWHLPYITQEDKNEFVNTSVMDPFFLVKASAGKCARVSYLTHDGKRDLGADVKLCDSLDTNGHMSPLEHPATPMLIKDITKRCGNFRGWKQYRKMIQGESDILGYRKTNAN